MHNCIEWLIESTKKFPDKIAVIEEQNKISYTELLKRTQSVATYLIKKEVFNQPIILFTDKSIDTLSAFFGIALASDFYTLINPELPETRIMQIKDTIGAKYVITDDNYYELAQASLERGYNDNEYDLNKGDCYNLLYGICHSDNTIHYDSDDLNTHQTFIVAVKRNQ